MSFPSLNYQQSLQKVISILGTLQKHFNQYFIYVFIYFAYPSVDYCFWGPNPAPAPHHHTTEKLKIKKTYCVCINIHTCTDTQIQYLPSISIFPKDNFVVAATQKLFCPPSREMIQLAGKVIGGAIISNPSTTNWKNQNHAEQQK